MMEGAPEQGVQEDGGTSKMSDNIGTTTTQGVPLSELDGLESRKDGLRTNWENYWR